MPMGVVMAALAIRQDYEPADLRRRAAREGDRRAALRLLAIANALEGVPRAEAARLAGMERQALRDAVLRFNAEGPEGLHDRRRPGRRERLSAGQQAALKAPILRGPRPVRGQRLSPGGPVRARRAGLWGALQRLGPFGAAQAARPLTPEDPPLAPQGRPGRAGGL
jgi:hypothetical protein